VHFVSVYNEAENQYLEHVLLCTSSVYLLAKRHKTMSNAQVTIESMINWFRKSDFGGLNLGVAVFNCRITWYIIC